MVLIDGKKEGDVEILPLSPTSELYGKSGTIVEFTPAQEVYNLEPISINFSEVKEMCRIWSYLTKGVTFDLTNYQTSEHIVYLSKNGLLDLISDQDVTPINKVPLYGTIKEDGIEAEIAIQWTQSRYEDWHVFTNGLENSEGGTSLTGFKTAFTNFFKKNISHEIDPEILRKGVHYAISCKIPHPSFSNQTKQKVNNSELRGLCQRLTTKMLEDFASSRRNEFDCIIEIMSKEIKAEAAAERARKQVLEAVKDVEKNQKKKVFASDKLKDAEFLGQDSMLLLVEGLSAASSVAMARDTKHYGILALRGKPLNLFTAPEEKIYQNEEIKLLLSAMNIVPGRYDSKKLRYGKIGILSDADADGYAIGLLIMCALYKLAPQFVEEGRLCWMRSPLYIVKQKNKEEYYYTDEEFNNRTSIKGEIQRCKGLGALSAEQAHNSMFTPEFQKIDTLIPDEYTLPLLMDLMGDDSSKKHDFIFENLDFSEIRE